MKGSHFRADGILLDGFFIGFWIPVFRVQRLRANVAGIGSCLCLHANKG